MDRPDWDERYRTGDAPWDGGVPSHELSRVLDEYGIEPCSALEVGCGTGTNCIYLATLGFHVTGVDISQVAIEAARKRAADAGVDCRLLAADVLNLPELGGPFDFVFDRGCFHTVRRSSDTAEAAMVDMFRCQVAPGGYLLVLAGNAAEPLDPGPPTVSEEEIRSAFADGFEILHLREFRFKSGPNPKRRPLAWSLLLKRAA